ncbi:MAG: LicD family protein [Ruminococcaceae bacterium]|nr:LicD family protein [Oscillospiraceae bacterium]
MENKPMTLSEIHHDTMGLLKKLAEICDEIGINYFMAYGSLLGVVRHKGFIPWDDDTDVIMRRPDYDKFKKYCLENEQALLPYKFMGWENSENYPFALWRFCDTRYRLESDDYPDGGMGLFIDVYCYDGAGDEQVPAGHPLRKRQKMYETFIFLINDGKFKKSPKGIVRTIVKFPLYVVAKLLGRNFFMKKLDSLHDTFSFEDSALLNSLSWDFSMVSRKREWYDEFTFLPLNDMMVKVPKEYDAVLRASYGDYMQLPPEDKRTPSHSYRLYKKEEFFK